MNEKIADTSLGGWELEKKRAAGDKFVRKNGAGLDLGGIIPGWEGRIFRMRHQSHFSVKRWIEIKRNYYGFKMWGKDWKTDATDATTWPPQVAAMNDRDKVVATIVSVEGVFFNPVDGSEVDFSELSSEFGVDGMSPLRSRLIEVFWPDFPIEEMSESDTDNLYNESNWNFKLLEELEDLHDKWNSLIKYVDVDPTSSQYTVSPGIIILTDS